MLSGKIAKNIFEKSLVFSKTHVSLFCNQQTTKNEAYDTDIKNIR